MANNRNFWQSLGRSIGIGLEVLPEYQQRKMNIENEAALQNFKVMLDAKTRKDDMADWMKKFNLENPPAVPQPQGDLKAGYTAFERGGVPASGFGVGFGGDDYQIYSPVPTTNRTETISGEDMLALRKKELEIQKLEKELMGKPTSPNYAQISHAGAEKFNKANALTPTDISLLTEANIDIPQVPTTTPENIFNRDYRAQAAGQGLDADSIMNVIQTLGKPPQPKATPQFNRPYEKDGYNAPSTNVLGQPSARLKNDVKELKNAIASGKKTEDINWDAIASQYGQDYANALKAELSK